MELVRSRVTLVSGTKRASGTHAGTHGKLMRACHMVSALLAAAAPLLLAPAASARAQGAAATATTLVSSVSRRHAEFPVPGRHMSGAVLDELSGVPIALALVTIPTADRTVLTGADGRYRFTDLPAGVYTVRVRQIGYVPSELVVRVLDLPVAPQRPRDSALVVHRAYDIRLRRLAVRLDTAYVRVRDDRPCRGRGWASATDAHPQVAVLFGELRANAERFRLLAERFPMEYRVQRAERFALSTGSSFTQRTDTLRRRSDLRRPYEPGKVFDREPSYGAFGPGGPTVGAAGEVRVPGFAEVASHAFQAHHCFRYAGVQMFGSRIYYRVDFMPTADVLGPDVEGSLYVDSDNFLLRRSVFRMTNVPKGLRVRSVEVVTTYRELYPTFLVADSLDSREAVRGVRISKVPVTEFTQHDRLLDHRFVGEDPFKAGRVGVKD